MVSFPLSPAGTPPDVADLAAVVSKLRDLFAGIQLGKNHEAWSRMARGGTDDGDEEPNGPRYWDLDEEDDEDWHQAAPRARVPMVVPVVSPTWSGAVVTGTF